VRVLVKEVNWLGDLVISLPALHAVRGSASDGRVAVLVRRELAGFFDGFDWVEVLPYAFRPGVRGLLDRWRLARDLRARGFDLAVLFPKSFDAALLVALARIPRRLGWRSDGRGILLTQAVPLPRERERHQSEDYLELLGHLRTGVAAAETPLLPVAPRQRDEMAAWLARRRANPSAPLIALAVAAAYGPAKEWPAEHFAALIDLLATAGCECVLVGAPDERDRCAAVASASRAGALVVAGETGIGETIGLLSLCQGFAGNDSGATHVAAALGVPTVAVFGSTEPRRTGPRGGRTRILYQRIACSPCLARTCRYGHYDCLRAITPTHVVEALADLGAIASPA